MNNNEHSKPNSTESISNLDADKLGRLLAAVARVADARLELAESRTEILQLLIELTDSAAGFWAWGVSNEPARAAALIAKIDVGFTEVESRGIMNTHVDPTILEEFRVPIMKQRGQRRQCTTLRTDFYNDQQWKATRMRANLAVAGFDEWLHSVRFIGLETWSSIQLFRHTGDAPYVPADWQLLDLAMASIPWLSATLERGPAAESCSALTERQRTVLLMQLDGLPRKEIASRLEISLDTVGDHVKKIYEQFEVSSTGELTALFLRNR